MLKIISVVKLNQSRLNYSQDFINFQPQLVLKYSYYIIHNIWIRKTHGRKSGSCLHRTIVNGKVRFIRSTSFQKA